jgi:hypothetical protein
MKDSNIVEFESRASLEENMRKSFRQYILLGEQAEAPRKYYLVELDAPSQSTGLGLISSGLGVTPSAVFLNARIVLVGHDRCVSAVDPTRAQEVFCTPIVGRFDCFLSDQVSDSILVLHELGLFRLLLDGKIEWKVDTGIVEDFRQEGNLVTLKIMDDNKLIVVDTAVGATLA